MSPESATPKLGVIKGLLIILFGIVFGFWLFGFSLSRYLDYTGPEPALIGLTCFAVVSGVCTWRGAVAIHRRNRKKVSPITIGVWTLLTITAAAWLFYML